MAITVVGIHDADKSLSVTASGAEKDLITPYAGEGQADHSNAGSNRRYAIDHGDGSSYTISLKLAQDVLSAAELQALGLADGSTLPSQVGVAVLTADGTWRVAYGDVSAAGQAYLDSLSQLPPGSLGEGYVSRTSATGTFWLSGQARDGLEAA